MVLFKMFNKSSSDLVKVGFVHDKPWRLEFKHAEKSPVITQTAFPFQPGSLLSKTSIKHLTSWGFVDAQLSTSALAADVSYKMPYVQGTTLGAHLEHKLSTTASPKQLVEVSLEHSSEKKQYIKQGTLAIQAPHVKLSFDPIFSKWIGSAAIGINLSPMSVLHIGGEATGLANLKSLSYSVGAAFSQTSQGKFWNASVLLQPHSGQPLNKAVAGVYCKSLMPASPEVGAEITHYLDASQTPELAIVGQWYLGQKSESHKTDTTMKVKLTQDSKIAAALTHKFSDSTSATFGTEFGATKGEALQYGVAFKVGF